MKKLISNKKKDRKIFVFLSSAMSIDGRIATSCNNSELSTKNDWRRVHQLRATVDGIMVGSGTIRLDNPSLQVKQEYFSKKKNKSWQNPQRIIVTTNCNIPLDAKVVKTAKEVPTIIATTSKSPSHKIKELKNNGCHVLICDINEEGMVDLYHLLSLLSDKFNIKTLMLEGGAHLNFSMLQAGLIDEAYIAIAPVIAGKGISLFENSIGYEKFSHSPLFRLKTTEIIDDMILLIYTIDHNKKRIID